MKAKQRWLDIGGVSFHQICVDAPIYISITVNELLKKEIAQMHAFSQVRSSLFFLLAWHVHSCAAIVENFHTQAVRDVPSQDGLTILSCEDNDGFTFDTNKLLDSSTIGELEKDLALEKPSNWSAQKDIYLTIIQ